VCERERERERETEIAWKERLQFTENCPIYKELFRIDRILQFVRGEREDMQTPRMAKQKLQTLFPG
jgi:hypothetical protein